MSSGHAWCQVVKILRGHTSTRHLSGRGRGGGGAECRAPEVSALWTARATGAGWGWGWAMFGRLVNRNVAHTAVLKGSPTLPGLPPSHGGRAAALAHLPLMSWGTGKAGSQVPALVSLILIAGAFWPPQLLYLLIDLPITAPSVLPLHPKDVLLIHMAHVIVLILLIFLVLPLLLLTLHLHPHLALDI